MKSRRIVFVSCTHVGSTVALWPEAFELGDGVVIAGSPAQQVILEYWNDFWTHEAKDADTIILLGDLCQGKNPKDFGLGSMTTDLQLQAAAFESLLEPHINGRAIHGVSGSKYHDSFDMRLDEMIVKNLGGNFYGMLKSLKLKGPDVVLNIAHGGSSPSMYKGSHDDREMMLMSANDMTDKIQFAARGHWHYFQYLKNSDRAILRVPGWQCWYGAKFMLDMLGKKNNKLGAVTVDFGPNKKTVVHERLYEPPLTWAAPEEI